MNSAVPVIPETAPFSPEQRAWLNGFLAGLFSRSGASEVSNLKSQISNSAAPLAPLTILFGSQTGTAEGLAKRAAKEAGGRGFAATVVDMAQIQAARLAPEQNVLVITSTYGEGDPPDNAKALRAALAAPEAPTLAGVRFSVCALGDTHYARFCQCGKDFDALLEKLGATRVAERVDCDLDYEAKFSAWLDAALAALSAGDKFQATSPQTASADARIGNQGSKIENPGAYSRQNPFPAPVLVVRNLNGAGSAKEVDHVELSLENSGLAYEPGDALGVIPQNWPSLVDEVIAALDCDGEEAVPTPAGELPLRTALALHYDLGKPPAALRELVGACSQAMAGAVPENIASKLAPTNSNEPLDVLDLLQTHPDTRPSPADFVRRLRKLQPRLYSIASSPKAHPGQVHLTVGVVRYEANDRQRKGVCSTFLAERAVSAGRVGVFVHTNRAFRLPASGDTPVIMVGPGTGVAPFRAFLEERRAAGAGGRNWLFFGDQREAVDFLHRDELLAFRRDGLLTRLDLAWSRDQAGKVYVQHRMLENATELFRWLEAGAHFYVCGDASRMARGVDAALHRIIETGGGRTPEESAEYVQALRASKRYARDVY